MPGIAMNRRGYAIAGGLLALIAAVGLAFWLTKPDEARGNSFLRDGEAGFVVTQFRYALGPDASETGACPNGLSKSVVELYGEMPEGQRRPGESDSEYGERLEAGGYAMSHTASGKNFCMYPELAPAEPHYQTLLASNVPAEGIDIDGKVTSASSSSWLADFTGADGTRGIDNQFFRVVGCSRSYQSDGMANLFQTEMYTGAWGILITLGDVDDLQNDDSVEVGIYANADPMRLSPSREALSYATYAMDQDPAYRAVTRGRIENGVLTTDPVDVRLRYTINSMLTDRVMRDAKIRATVAPSGKIKGTLGGFSPVTELYDQQFGFRNARDESGKLAPLKLRLNTANGAARVLGHTCQGAWQALHRLADGHPDPKSGRNTSISTQYLFEAMPAFVVDVDTRSENEELARNE